VLYRSAVAITLLAGLVAGCTGEILSDTCPSCERKVIATHGGTDAAAPDPVAVNLTCLAVAPPEHLVEARRAFPALPALSEPVALAGPVNQRWYVLERKGKVRRFEARPDASALTDVVDLTAEVDPEGDAGLVAGAFHPRFGQGGEGRLFLSYTAHGGTVMRSRVISLTTTDGGTLFPDTSRRVIFDFDQTNPWRIHLNADMRFGPDGYLYAGFGDGAPMGDPDGHAQDRDDYRGKILRVDVDHGDPYAVPDDNPFVGMAALPEVYALGFRNPWRFSFDRATGTLWAGDVGAYTWEEVDRVPAGGNLGWPLREGSHCLNNPPCDEPDLVDPVLDYAHDGQASAVVGGFVYHGTAVPELIGRYVFADYSRGDVFAVAGSGTPQLIARTGRRITSFAEEPNGELLIVDLEGGEILRLEPAPPPAALVAPLLSGTGCFDPADPHRPAPGLLPYEVRVPFWSDGADKTRFLALPEGVPATIRADGQFVLPVGSVLVKQFQLGGRPIETRLMMKYRDSQWAGYSYAWDPDGSDARLVPEAGETLLQGSTPLWSYPSRDNCLGCHNRDRALGLEVDQLDFDADAEGNMRPSSTLSRWRQAGLVEGDVPAIPRLPRVDGKAPLERRARAYLHANCSICHSPGGPTPVDLDLRFSTLLGQTRLCGVAAAEGDLGVAGAQRMIPGDPGRSLLALRMRARGRDHMPPIGPQQVDDKGAALIEAWIRGLAACP
jgi:uncharacterized repeat protein (TIGR03806 family)